MAKPNFGSKRGATGGMGGLPPMGKMKTKGYADGTDGRHGDTGKAPPSLKFSHGMKGNDGSHYRC